MSTCPVEIAQALVRIPSVNVAYDADSPGAAPVFAWIEAWAAERGIPTERHSFGDAGLENLVLTLENGSGPHFLLNGHCDTVSVAGMTIEPWSGELRDGRLWGRGSADMKGPVAAMLATLVRLQESRDSWRGRVTAAFTPDEEVATAGIRALMTQLPKPDFALVGEPSQMKPVKGCKGGLRFTLRCFGRAAHSSRPTMGRSAIVAMAEAILALQEYFEKVLGSTHLPGFGPCTGSIGTIKGGSGINIVPDECAIQIDIRLIPGQEPMAVYAALQEWFHARFPEVEEADGGKGIRWAFELLHTDIAFELPQEHAFTTTVCGLTKSREATIAFYCCDASKVAAAGVPCLILGPGDIAEAHTARESIGVEELQQGVEVYLEVVRNYLKPH